MARYMTAQRKALLDFFCKNPDRQFSAKQIEQALRHNAISLSAIYRNLAYLTEEHHLTRTIKAGSEECFYQYIEHDACKNALHLTCTKCGKISHMNEQALAQMLHNLMQADGFVINKSQTVLFGLCKQCCLLP